MDNISKKLIFRTIKVAVCKILAAGLAFLLQMRLSLFLGMEGYGQFSLFISIANILSILPLLGMDSGLIRSIASASAAGIRKWNVLVSLRIAGALLLFLLMLLPLAFPLLGDAISLPTDMMVPLMLYLAAFVMNTLAGAVLQGEQRNVMQDATVVMAALGRLGGIYVLEQQGDGLQEVLHVFILAELCCAVFRWGIVWKGYWSVLADWQPLSSAKQYILYCLPLFFVASIGLLKGSLHRFVVAYYMDASSVGILRVCEIFGSMLSLFINPFVTTWPLMAEYYSQGRMDAIQKMLHRTSVLITVCIMPAFVTLLICAKELLELFGLSLEQRPYLFWILLLFCVGTVYDAMIGPAGALLNMTEYSRISFYNSVILLATTILLSCFMIPRWGLLGAAGALSLSQIVINTLNALQNRRILGIFPYGKEQLDVILLSFPIYAICRKIYLMIPLDGIVCVLLLGFMVYGIYGISTMLLLKKSWSSLQ